MKNGLRQSMAWLHDRMGLVFTWLLFAICFTGTLSYYRDEISLWMQPELHQVQPDGVYRLDAAVALLRHRAAGARSWTLALPGARDPVLELRWSMSGKFERGSRALLDPATGMELQPRATLGGGFFRNFHFSLLLGRSGWWIVGLATMVMLVALVTGLIVHKRIFKDFFKLRLRASKPRAWLDAHNMSGVMALPYHLAISYTGLIMLMYGLMPAGIAAFYQPSTGNSFFADLSPRAEAPPATGRQAALIDLGTVLAQARRHWNGADAGLVTVHHPGDAGAVIDVQQRRGAAGIRGRTEPVLRFDGSSGALIAAYETGSAALGAYGFLYGLHTAWFANPAIRALFFVLGLASCLMMASGSVLWLSKQRLRRGPPQGVQYLVSGLNVAGFAGLTIACAAYFWANRLLPAEWPERGAAEVRCFFFAWTATGLHALLRVRDAAAAWREQLGAAALLWAALPLLNAVTGGLALPQALARQHAALAGFDLASLGFGLLLAALGLHLGRRTAAAREHAADPRAAAPLRPVS